MVTKLKSSILFLGVILLLCLFYLFFFGINNYGDASPWSMVSRNYYGVQSELVRYAKNINRYFLYYDGTRFETEQWLTDTDRKEYAARQLSLLVDEEARLEEEYRNRIIEGYDVNDAMDSYPWVFSDTSGDGSAYYYINSDTDISSVLRVNEKLYWEKSQALEEIRSKYNVSYTQMQEDILTEKKQNYEAIKQYLSETQNTFQYYLYDTSDFTVYSNIPRVVAEIDNRTDGSVYAQNEAQAFRDYDCYLSIDLSDMILQNHSFNGMPLAASFEERGLQGFIAMPYESSLVNELQGFTRRQNLYHAYSIIAAAASFILLMALLVFCFASRLKHFIAGNAFFYGLYLRQPFLVKAAFSLMLCLSFLAQPFYAPGIFNNFTYSFLDGLFRMTIIVGVYSACALYLTLSLEYGFITLRRIKNLKDEPEFQLICGLGQDTKSLWQTQNRVLSLFCAVVLLVTAAGITVTAFFAIYCAFIRELGIGAVILLCYAAALMLALVISHFISGYVRLTSAIHNMSEGNFEHIAPVKGIFSKPLTELAGLEEGLRKSIAEAVKSQRLKAELITNVSHDLKTPLTSIINYVDLLKKNAGYSNDGTALEYIEVLEKKSRRLQVLIEDLFEVSKLNSGSAELTLNVVDLVDLLKQTLGEMSEKITASTVIFRVQCERDHIYTYVDGKKIWRLFENLLNNILKYSQPNSRAYISMEEKNDLIELVFKNVSAYEICFDPEELFERFKRGDDSRTAEGSGLGLSIAKSIAELHNGSMEIIVDGDLFKVALTLPKAG